MYRMYSLMLLLLLCLFTWLIVSLTYRLLECAFHSFPLLDELWNNSMAEYTRFFSPFESKYEAEWIWRCLRCRRLMACWTSIGETSEKRYSKCAVIKQLEKSICAVSVLRRDELESSVCRQRREVVYVMVLNDALSWSHEPSVLHMPWQAGSSTTA